MTAGTAAESASPRAALLDDVRERLGGLRPSEAKVAAVVLERPVEVVDLNMAGLARAAGVSEPTVMRFCAALGFEGFRSFKMALARATALGLPVTHSAITSRETPAQLTEKVFDHTISSLALARESIVPAAVEAAIEALVAASDVLFVGFGASGIIAQDAQQKFPLFGVACHAPADHHQQFMAASMSSPRSVVVAVSATGATRETLRVARAARAAGATVIALTGTRGPLSEVAHVELLVPTFEDTDHLTPMVSRLAGLVVVDVLATGVALRRGGEHQARVRAMKDELARMRAGRGGAPEG